MINKFAKMHNSIFTKIVLTVTALSFMSLFGISGYISSANSNKTVAKVDGFEISQSEFSYLLQRKLLEFKNMSGIDLEENSEQKAQIAEALLKAKVDEMILDNTMKKYDIDFPDSLIREIILVTPQFSVNGEFNKELYKWYLQRSGQSEKEYINELKRSLARQILLDSQVAYARVPDIEQQLMEKLLGQRRTFKYAKIENKKTAVTRQPSKEELDQYYSDMKDELMLPETRDIRVLFISQDDFKKKMNIEDEEIAAYYKEHIDEFEQPEQRKVLQIVYNSEQDAEQAYSQLIKGADFIKMAEQNGQTAQDTDLGFVGKDDLSEELADIIFNQPLNVISKPQQIADSWQILKVTATKSAVKMPEDQAKAIIINEIKEDKIYDTVLETISYIEDALGNNTEMSSLSEEFGVDIFEVKGLSEDGNYVEADASMANVLKNMDVLDTVFSYNEGEIGRTIEIDDGLAVIEVVQINEAHQLPRDEAEAKLRQFWLENERNSIVQELIDNVQHDFDAGDDLTTVARRYKLPVKNTMPVTRNETIDNLTSNEMRILFASSKGEPQTIQLGDDYIIVETTDIYDDKSSLSDADKKLINQALYQESIREMSDALLRDFAKDYKIEINYNRVGLDEE